MLLMALKLIEEPFLRAMNDLETDKDGDDFDYAKMSQVMPLLVGYLGGDDNPANNAKLADDAMQVAMKRNLQKEGYEKYYRTAWS